MSVRFASQQPLDTAATVDADTTAPVLWQRVVDEAWLFERVALGIDEIAGQYAHRDDRVRAIIDAGVTGSECLYAYACACIHGYHSEPGREGLQHLLPYPDTDDGYGYHGRALYDFGTGKRSVLGIHLALDDLVDGPLAVLRTVNDEPTIAIRVGQQFKDLTAEQRRNVCQLISHLGTTFDVAVVASGYWQRTLVREHGEQLPAAVSETISTTRLDTRVSAEIEARVDAARDRYDPDGSALLILRELAESPAKTVTYQQLYSEVPLTEEGVRNRLVALNQDGLIQTGTNSNSKGVAELLTAGSKLVERVTEEVGRQQPLDVAVSETRNRCDDSRVTHARAHGRDGQGPQPQQRPAAEASEATEPERADGRGKRITDSPMPAWNAVAAGCSAPMGGIGLVDYPIEELPDERSRDRLWRYDEDQDRLTVSSECTNPMQYGVGTALALVSPWTFRHVLTPDRLEGECGDSDAPIGDLLTESPGLLRDTTCLGYLKDADASGEAYIEALQDARENLLELLTRWDREEYDCSAEQFRGIILREAHGLAGTIVHLCSLCGVDVSRELRIPTFSKDVKSNASLRSAIVETITKHVSIQSKIGLYAAHRQLCEQREDKRRGAGRPVVDADDPYGEFIGSMTIVGPGVSDLEDELRDELAGIDVHDDAPEFSVPVEVNGDVNDTRGAFARSLIESCGRKGKRLRWEQVQQLSGYLTALLGSPYDVAKALNRLDSDGSNGGELRDDELRYALATLDPKRVVPAEGKPALSKLVHALVVGGQHLPQSHSDLAERADISAKSVSAHIETAEEMAFADRHEVDSPHDDRISGVWFTAARPTYKPFGRAASLQVARSVADPELIVGGPAGPEGDPPPIRTVSAARIGKQPTQRSLAGSARTVTAGAD